MDTCVDCLNKTDCNIETFLQKTVGSFYSTGKKGHFFVEKDFSDTNFWLVVRECQRKENIRVSWLLPTPAATIYF